MMTIYSPKGSMHTWFHFRLCYLYNVYGRRWKYEYIGFCLDSVGDVKTNYIIGDYIA